MTFRHFRDFAEVVRNPDGISQKKVQFSRPFFATEGGNKRDFCEHARNGGQKRDFGDHATIGGNKRDLYPRPVWCGRVGGCGGNTRDFGEHATKGGNKRDFGKHATKVGTLKEFRKKDANFAIFLRNRKWE